MNGTESFLMSPFAWIALLFLVLAGAVLLKFARRLSLPSMNRLNNLVRSLEAETREREKATQAFIESRARFQAVADSSPVGIFVTNMQGNCIYVNRRGQEIAGLAEEDTTGAGWMASVHPEDLGLVQEKMLEAMRDKVPYEISHRFLHRGGQIVWANVKTAIIGELHDTWGYVGTVEDITEKRQSEERLRSHTAALERLNRTMMGREERIIELKDEIKELRLKLKEKEGDPDE